MNVNTSLHFVYRAVINKYTPQPPPPPPPPLFSAQCAQIATFQHKQMLSKQKRQRAEGGGGGGGGQAREKKQKTQLYIRARARDPC